MKKGLRTESQSFWIDSSYVSVNVTTDDDRIVGLAEWLFHKVEGVLAGLEQEPPLTFTEVMEIARDKANAQF
jgi:hypothetical protein